MLPLWVVMDGVTRALSAVGLVYALGLGVIWFLGTRD